MITIDIPVLYADSGTAKLSLLSEYEAAVIRLAGDGGEVTLTGAGPVWLYLRLAHVLHGKVRRLLYSSPVTGDVVIFDHNPY